VFPGGQQQSVPQGTWLPGQLGTAVPVGSGAGSVGWVVSVGCDGWVGWEGCVGCDGCVGWGPGVGGPEKPRRAASVSCNTTPAAVTPPRPSRPFSSPRREPPRAKARVKASNRRSSIVGCPLRTARMEREMHTRADMNSWQHSVSGIHPQFLENLPSHRARRERTLPYVFPLDELLAAGTKDLEPWTIIATSPVRR
jgi:hypothetical protein